MLNVSTVKGGKKMKDPVCFMEVNESRAAGKVSYKGKTYYFCSTSCMETFKKKPEKYVKG